jgi:hypothetical protein
MKNFYPLLIVVVTIVLTEFSANAQNVGIGTATPNQKLEIAGSTNTIRIIGLKSGAGYNQNNQATSTSDIMYVNSATGDIYALPTGPTGSVLTISTGSVPTWVQPTTGTVTSVGAISPLFITNPTSTPVISLIGTAGQILYGTGTSSAFTTGGSSGEVLGWSTTGIPTWSTGSGQFIQNQSSAQQTANFWISGNASIGTAPVAGQQLTVGSSGSGSIGIYSTNTAGSGMSVEGINSGGGTGILGTVSGNTSSNNGGYGIEGAASSGGTGVWANSSGQTNGSTPLGGFGVFATGTSNSQAGIYSYIGTSAPSPHGTTIPALGAVYAQTNSTTGTWAVVANNSGSATPTNNGLLVFGTTSAIGAVTLGSNTTSYFTTGGAKANGSLIFDNSTNTNTVTINTGVTSSTYGLTLPVAQGVSGSLLYNTDGAGTLSFSSAGTSGQVLTANTSGVPTWITLTTGVGLVTVNSPLSNSGTTSSPVINLIGTAGTILYGTGTASAFTAAGTSGQVLESGGAGVPTWGSANSALTTSNVVTATSGVTITNGTGQVIGASNVSVDVATNSSSSPGLVPAPTGNNLAYVSNGTGVPVWANANASLSTSNITNTGSGSSVIVGNGTGQVVGASNVILDVQGASGGIFYGTGAGTSATFTSAGTSGQVLQSTGTGVPTWVTPTTGTVTQITANTPLSILNQTTTPVISLAGTAGTLLYGTGTASAFTPAGTAGQILESAGTGVPTWSTGSGQFIQNQSGAQQTANFWISGNAGIGTAPVAGQQLTVGSSGSGSIGIYSTNTAGSGMSVEGINSGGGTGILGTVSGNTSSNNGGYGIEGAASSGGTGVWANSSGQTNASTPLGGFGVFATGTSNSQAGIYSYIGTSAPSPHGTTIPALGAVYAQTNSTTGTWAVVANNSGSATPTNNGLLVFGTTSAIGAVTLGSNTTSYFTTGGAKANGSLIFDNSTNTNTVTINTGVTSANYALTLPTAQGVLNSVLYNADGSGTLAFSSAGTSGQVLSANSSGVPTWTTLATEVSSVGTATPIYNMGTSSAPVIAIQGLSSGADAGGVLYSTGSGSSAVFNLTGTAGQVLVSGGTGVPTWVTPTTATVTSVGMSVPSAFNVSGSPITTSGTFTITGAGTTSQYIDGTGSLQTFPTLTSGTVTQVMANIPLSVLNQTTTPVISLTGTAGTLLYGTGTASAFTPAGTAGQILESAGSGVPTWVTGSGQFIQNQSSAQQTANFWISGNAGIGTAPVTTQQLTVVASSTGIAIAVSASGSGSIGVVATTTASSGGGIEGNNSGGGFGVFGNVSGNTSSNNGGYGVEGAASSGGVGVYANSSGKTNASTPLGGFGLFATGTLSSQAAVYGYLESISGATPTPHGTVIPAMGAVYAETNYSTGAWALIANNSAGGTTPTPTNNGLLVFGTTNAIGTLTLGSNTSSYFTTSGVIYPTNAGSLVFANGSSSTPYTTTINANTAATSSYTLTLPAAQGAAGSLLYNTNGAGALAFSSAGTSGQVLLVNSSGVPTWTTLATGVSSVGTAAPIYNTGTSTAPVIAIQGLPSGADAGGVLYSTGSGTSAVFNLTGTAGQVLESGGTGVPTWASANSALTTSNIINTGSGSSVVIGNGSNQVVGASNVTLDVQGTSGGIFYGTGAGTSATFTSAGTSGQVLQSTGTGVPTWVTQTTGTVTQVTANIPLSILNQTTTPIISLTGTAGTLLYGTGTASTFTPAGTTGEVLLSGGTGVPTWSTGSGQFIQNQSSAQQTANFWISGNASIGIAPVAGQQLTVGSSGSGSIGIYSTNTAGSGMSVEGINSGGGTGLLGTVSGNTSSNNGGYGIEGAASSGGTGVWANSSGQTNATTPLGGFGLFATGTFNSQAGVYAFLNGVSGGTPSPHGTTIPALGAVYAQTTSTTGAWAVVANNSGSATPTNNGLLVFGTTSAIGAVTLGSNTTSYFTTGGAKANGSLIFDNSANTNTVTINTGVTVASYSLNLPTAQASAAGQVLTNDGTGVLSWTSPTTGTVTSVGTAVPIYNTGTSATPVIAIQGLPSGADVGGVLYSTGSGTSAVFNLTGTAGQVLESGGTGVPTWVTPTTGTVTSVGMTVPPAFSVTPATITNSGTFEVTATGTTSQYIDGTGSLQAFPALTSGTVTQVTANLPLSILNQTTTPVISLTGTAGTLLYGTGTASAFTPAGTTGEVLLSGGTGVPTWSTANSALTTGSIVPGTGSSVVVGNGTGQVVGASNVTIDVRGTTGGIFYGTGTGAAADFTSAGTSGEVLQSTGTGAPIWVTPASGTVTSVSANLPLTVTGGTSPTPTLNLTGTAGTILYGTGTASAFTTAGTSGEVLESNGTGVPTWSTGSGQFIQNQNGISQTANFYISGNAGIGIAPQTAQQLTVASTSLSNTALVGTATATYGGTTTGQVGVAGLATGGAINYTVNTGSAFSVNSGLFGSAGAGNGTTTLGFGVVGLLGTSLTTSNPYPAGAGVLGAATSSGIGVAGYTSGGTGIGVEGMSSSTGTAVEGEATGNNGIGVEGYSNSGGAALYGRSTGTNGNGSGLPTGGYGVFATGTSNAEAAVYGNLVAGSPAPSATLPPVIGAIYAQTTLSGTWALVANNSVSATPTNNGLLVFGTTSAIGAVTLGSNTTSYFTTGGAKANGSLIFDNSTNANTVTINTGVTAASYSLNLPMAQATAPGQVLSNDGAGNLSWASTTTGTVTSVGTNQPLSVTGTSTAPVINLIGTAGTILYGTGTASAFTSAGTSGQILESTGTGVPTWANANSALSTSNVVTATSGVTITNGTGQVVGASNVSVDVAINSSSSPGLVPAPTGNNLAYVSNGTGAPVWANANASLSTSNITNTGSGSSLVVGNGTGQIVGASNVTLDVQGTSGGIFYGTGAGTSATFTSAGTSGQVLESTGTGVPTWVTSITGTVTSVGMSVPPAFSVTPSTITTTGTFAVTANGTTSQYIDGTGSLQTFPTLTSGTVTQVTANTPLSVLNQTTTPVISLAGTAGTLLYGTGTASAFTPAGTTGEILLSGGTGVPTWSTANLALTTSSIVPGTGSSVVVSNGTGQVVGASNVILDVQGTSGGIFYGTGTGSSATFTSAGSSGEVLESNGTSAPTWSSGSVQFIQNQSSSSQTANFEISGSGSIGSTLTLTPMTSGSVLFAGASGVVSQNNSNLYYNNSNNELGVGTNTPGHKLDVNGVTRTEGFEGKVVVMAGGSSNTTSGAALQLDSTVYFCIANNATSSNNYFVQLPNTATISVGHTIYFRDGMGNTHYLQIQSYGGSSNILATGHAIGTLNSSISFGASDSNSGNYDPASGTAQDGCILIWDGTNWDEIAQ